MKVQTTLSLSLSLSVSLYFRGVLSVTIIVGGNRRANTVQILDGTVCISLPANAIGWFGLVSLFNGISTFVGYLMPKPSL